VTGISTATYLSPKVSGLTKGGGRGGGLFSKSRKQKGEKN